jgi:hypothetical protein
MSSALTLHTWLDQLEPMRIDNQNCMVHLKSTSPIIYIDGAFVVHIHVTTNTVDISLVKKEVRAFLSRKE